jgi:hypothetical protein
MSPLRCRISARVKEHLQHCVGVRVARHGGDEVRSLEQVSGNPDRHLRNLSSSAGRLESNFLLFSLLQHLLQEVLQNQVRPIESTGVAPPGQAELLTSGV